MHSYRSFSISSPKSYFQTFPELVELASRGDNRKVDLLVHDTAGEDYNMCPQEGMVSSFGRAAIARANGQSRSLLIDEIPDHAT